MLTASASAPDGELARKAAAILGAFTNGEAVLSPDKSKVFFVSNRDGVPQVYAADANRPDSPAAKLSGVSERAGGPMPLPDGKRILFSSDRGGNEQPSLFRVDADGKNLLDLTPGGALTRNGTALAWKAPHTVFYSGRTAIHEAAAGIYASPIEKVGPAKWIYQDAHPGYLTDVRRDGKQALFRRIRSWSENQVVLVDLTTGQGQTLYPMTGQRVTVFDAAFSADGSRVLVATDGGAEQAVVLALDPKTNKELARYTETKVPAATIDDLTVAHNGNVLAVSLNCGNRNEVRLLDTQTLLPTVAVQMPLGAGYAGDFSEDGARLTAVWSTPDRPQDIYAIETKTGTVSPLRKEARPSLDTLPGIRATMTELASFDGTKIPVNVYLPAPASPSASEKKLPVIVSFHGGPTDFSAVRWSPMMRFFLSLGYAWVEPNVRGSVGFGRSFEAADNGPKRLDAFKDVEASARWVASQPWADKSRLVALGGSYGGYTVLMTLTRHPQLWRAGVDMFGIANFKTFMASTSGPVRDNYLTEIGDPEKDSAFLESISPLHDVAKIAAPLFIYAGKNDPRVPKSESDQIVKALLERKLPVEYMVKDNEGHGIEHRENQVEFYARVARFLETHLH